MAILSGYSRCSKMSNREAHWFVDEDGAEFSLYRCDGGPMKCVFSGTFDECEAEFLKAVEHDLV